MGNDSPEHSCGIPDPGEAARNEDCHSSDAEDRFSSAAKTKQTRLTRLLYALRLQENTPCAYIFAACCIALAAAVQMVLGALVAGIAPFTTLYPAIIIATLVGGVGPGMLAIVLGGMSAWVFVLTPSLGFALPTPPEAMSLLLYMLSGSLILIIVADRRTAEAALREERDRARLYFETAGALLLVLGTDRKVRLINRAGTQVLGAPAEAIVGKDWVETFVPERFRSRANAAFAACLQEKDDLPDAAEGVVLRSDGTQRVIAWRSTVLRDRDGRVTGVLSSGEDVTDGRRAERKLHESELRFKALAESMPQLLWSTRADGHCDYLSRQWQEFTGVAEAEHLGTGWLNAVHPDDRPQITVAWNAAVQTSGRYDVTYRLRRHDGTYRWFAARGQPVVDERGSIQRWFGTSTDITEIVEARHELEERVAERKRELEESNRALLAEAAEREKAEAALARAQRLEAIGQLTGGVAHDFNNLLTVVVGNLEMIIRSSEDPERVRRYAATAMSAADRGESVTRQLLAFSRQQTLKPETVDVNRLLGNFAALARRAAGEAIELRIETAPEPLYCRLDPTQFEVAMLNLTVNARDATPPGGRIAVSARGCRVGGLADENACDLPPEMPSGDYVVVSMTDTGAGIPADVLPRVFEPFFTTKDVGKGSGLGLSQVYGFVRQSGGYVRVDSEPGKGTTVSIFLPRREAPASTGETRPARIPHAASASGEAILLVEDDADVRQIALGMLSGLGYRVVVARDGLAALEILEGSQHLDLLFTDVVMPRGMSGAELAERAGRLRPGLPVLLASGYAARALSEEHGVAEEMPLLRKPYRIGELARAVRSALAASKPAAATQAGDGCLRVLVVEDDVFVRLSAVTLLNEVGFTVVADAGNAEAALARLTQLRGGVDVLFTDVGLPGMDGHALAEEARRRVPAIRVVFATGYASEGATGEDGDIVVAKPFHRSDLEELRRALCG